MKQRQKQYLINNEQHISASRGGYLPANFTNQSITQTQNTYSMLGDQQQKLRLLFSIQYNN